MKKQYMDFVPTAKQKTQSGALKARVQPVNSGKKAVNGATHKVLRPTQAQMGVSRGVGAMQMQRSVGRMPNQAQIQRNTVMTKTSVFSIRNETELGVIQDTNTHFVQTEVTKRPLSGQYFGERQIDAKKVKAEKIGNKSKKLVEIRREPEPTEIKETYVPPRSKFINQGKIEKRPLSKTVYHKVVPVPVEEPKGPVTIITKPEKQSHAGLIVTIILTIILGAAAGTVAFLLLPK